jgi:hypothetical protein
MSRYSFSGMEINLPDRNPIDALAEQREQRDTCIKSRMNRRLFLQDVQAGLADLMDDERGPLGEVIDGLWDCPIRDEADFRGYLHMHSGDRLGAQIMRLVASISMNHFQDASDGF